MQCLVCFFQKSWKCFVNLNFLSKVTPKSFSYSPSLMVDLPMATTDSLLLLPNIIKWHIA